ncbi:hypothetical protein TNCV_988221 [Trichonephila clavipes]|nr:hypothetical protein TNCV_988221 [Trichonephila clavipes]
MNNEEPLDIPNFNFVVSYKRPKARAADVAIYLNTQDTSHFVTSHMDMHTKFTRSIGVYVSDVDVIPATEGKANPTRQYTLCFRKRDSRAKPIYIGFVRGADFVLLFYNRRSLKLHEGCRGGLRNFVPRSSDENDDLTLQAYRVILRTLSFERHQALASTRWGSSVSSRQTHDSANTDHEFVTLSSRLLKSNEYLRGT